VTDPVGRSEPDDSLDSDDSLDAADRPYPVGEAHAEGVQGLARPDVTDLDPSDLESLATQTLDQLEAVTTERDDYLDRLRRLQADFENYKKRSAKEHREAGERAKARLADQLLPVLDSCDAAMVHGASGVEPVFAALLGVLEKEGLERIDPLDATFDPELHEAVLHEHAEEPHDEPRVVEVLRYGYAWKGQVIRAAMVKVRG
jgi:molecular chaperone GrpE